VLNLRTVVVGGVVGAIAVGIWTLQMKAQQPAIPVDGDDIAGVVTSSKGPEAGVWVIAETTDLPTKYVKIVVTDDRGRYLLPDLPKANYSVWVRGYGLVDSSRVTSAPGKNLNLTATVAPSAGSAAQYYPASYWFSLMHIPDKKEFPGTGPSGNGISPKITSQAQWLALLKSGDASSCWSCHQLGNKATREIPASLGKFKTSADAWLRRLESGQAGPDMIESLGLFGPQRALAMLSDWTDRIAAGELPPVPPRPQGAERNAVITMWDWADSRAYLHDEIATDKRDPTVNAYGPIYGSAELSADYVPVLDPVHNTTSRIPIPVRDPDTTVVPGKPLQPSPYWGSEQIWNGKTNTHNPMLDEQGRLWLTARIRNDPDPAFCKAGSENPSAKLTPLTESIRELAVYDPKTKKMSLIDTCFTAHHLEFAADANRTLWTSSCAAVCGGSAAVVGWLNTKMWDETHDAQKSQGWTSLILDTNGNGKRDSYVEADQPVDPKKDKKINVIFYAVAPSPIDGSVWGAEVNFPGRIVHLIPGPNPPATALAEVYDVPWGDKSPIQGYAPRGLDIDRNGVVWTALASGHFASFDRRKCKGPLNGPNATGKQCPEGWTLYPQPGPQFKGLSDSGSVEASYYNWVDQFDTLGLGANVPVATGNGNEALLVLVNGKWVVLRVPYPLGFYAKGLDGRIDDAKAGWKGRGLWSTYATRAPFHTETGKGTLPKVVHFQIRPDPLAK
jgi:hypothetical protein